MKKLKVASFFSGLGGMDLGIEGNFEFLGNHYSKHPTTVVYAMDFDRSVTEVYNANFKVTCEHEDITQLDSLSVPDHDILTGGFPCQSFSIVAQNPKRLGYKDGSKGKLFFELCRILKDKQPSVFIAENVKGILSANKGEAFPLIIKEFEKAGYFIKYQLLNAVEYGIPQKRQRVFIIGFKKKKAFDAFSFPKPVVMTESEIVTLGKVVIPENQVDNRYYFSEKAVNGMLVSKNSKTMNKGRSQSLLEPCNTVGAHLAKVSLNSTDPVLCIDGKYRMFTPREVARIQSFPETFKLTGSHFTNYKGLGNAVPPVLMWHITRNVITALSS